MLLWLRTDSWIKCHGSAANKHPEREIQQSSWWRVRCFSLSAEMIVPSNYWFNVGIECKPSANLCYSIIQCSSYIILMFDQPARKFEPIRRVIAEWVAFKWKRNGPWTASAWPSTNQNWTPKPAKLPENCAAFFKFHESQFASWLTHTTSGAK